MIAPHFLDRARNISLVEAAGLLGLKLPRTGEYAGPCPACGGRDRFSINPRKAVWNCRGAGGGNDAIGLVEHVRGVDFRAAVEFLTGERDLPPAPRVECQPEPAGDDDTQRIGRARTLWREARDARGSVVDVYLKQARGLPPIDAATVRTIRFHPSFPMRGPADEPVRVPAMLCAMRDARAVLDFMAGARGELTEIEEQALADENFIRAIHATALLDDGSGKRFGKDSRRIRGVAKGSTIMLGDLWHVLYGGTLDAGEGIETMLAAISMGGSCAFALGSAGAVAGFEYLPHVLHLRLAAENDEASERSVRAAFTAWREQIDDVRVIRSTHGKDLADIARAAA
ncbi:toprim domain-containing protein [Methylosinus sporium]|uniref:DUF7146 domain-containing protein n=1 Tax=Methylosinus sporium TaxID=428 RepID=UPI00383A5F02